MTANSENNTTQVYKWTIETKTGIFTGTSLSIDEVNKEIAMLTNNARIIKKNIIPSFLTNENEDDKIYSWNEITNNGKESGISTSLKEAQSALNSFGTNEVIKSNTIESINIIK